MATDIVETPVETLDSALERAADAEARGDRQEAVRILRSEIPDQFPNDMRAFVQCGDLLARMQCFGEAEAVLRQGIEALPKEPWIARGHARTALSRNDISLALERFTAVRDTFPAFDIVHADIVQLLINLGRFPDAEAAGSEARQLFPENVWIADAHAAVAEARGDFAAALARWQHIRSTWPAHPPALSGEVRVLCRLGRFAEADALMADDAAPLVPRPWEEAANRAEQAGAWSFAATWWDRFRAAWPDEERGYVRAAIALLRSGDAEGARRLLDQAGTRWPASAALAAARTELNPAEPAAPAAPAPAPAPAKPRSSGFFAYLGW